MSKKYLAAFGFGVVLVLTGQTFAQSLKLPYQDYGACPFECCTYRQWTAKNSLVLYKNMSGNSPVAFRIRKGEKVTGVTGVVTTAPGKAEVLENVTLENSKLRLEKGDALLILTNKGEGFYRLWYKGKFYEDDPSAAGLKILTRPKSVWWVKIKNRRGRIGWTKASEKFDNQDRCG